MSVFVNGRGEPPRINIAGVNHYFGVGENRKQVLFDQNLVVMPGEIVIMTGPSGSGKTTLLTLIGGLRSVQEGSLIVDNQELRGLHERGLREVRRHMGFIFQAHNLFASLTAFQNVKMALQLRQPPITEQETTRLVTEMLGRLGLSERARYKPNSLSGGQRQRIAIARALVNRPAIVLADEPTAALDKESGRTVVDLLREFASKERSAILLVTHDARILDVADRIVNMVDGHIISNVHVDEAYTVVEFLTKCQYFAELPPATITDVANRLRRQRVAAGTVIVQEGAEPDKFYLIGAGSAFVSRRDESGHESQINELKAGDFFGEIALLRGGRRTATVTAGEGLLLYSLEKEDFDATMRLSSRLKDQILQVLFHRN